MYKIILFLSLFISTLSYATSDKEQILAILQQQQNAWNEGDINAYMQGYWHSDQLMFVGENGITYGWQATLNHYNKSYQNRAAMGHLIFTIIQVDISNKDAFVLGKWSLAFSDKNSRGYFTLQWKKFNNQWRIIVDHTSLIK